MAMAMATVKVTTEFRLRGIVFKREVGLSSKASNRKEGAARQVARRISWRVSPWKAMDAFGCVLKSSE